jgi:hypothetical protein
MARKLVLIALTSTTFIFNTASSLLIAGVPPLCTPVCDQVTQLSKRCSESDRSELKRARFVITDNTPNAVDISELNSRDVVIRTADEVVAERACLCDDKSFDLPKAMRACSTCIQDENGSIESMFRI